MRYCYNLDKSFGPGGSFAGMILVVFGLIMVPFYWTGIILIAIGAFVGFSGSGCEVDPVKRRVRSCLIHYGLFRTGDWRSIDTFRGIGVVRTTRGYSTFSLSNRTMINKQEDYRVVLEAKTPQSRMEVMKCSSREEATTRAMGLAEVLGMEMLDNRKSGS